MIHGMPSRRRLLAGDLVTIEHAGVFARYHVIVMRTISLGEPVARVREVARVQAEALAAGQAAVRPDGPVRAADDACRAVLRAAGLEAFLLHRLGFSLGVAYPPSWIEGMSIWAADPHRFAPGMVFSLEPNLCLAAEGFALKLGDTVLMGAGGPETLSGVARDVLVAP
jgi:Xaa-Pro dipeptidase